MRLDKIKQMSVVMRALYEREFQVIRAILTEESDLRRKLNQLDHQISENRNVRANSHNLQSVGADLLWQGWTTRMRRELNTELAQVMAKKLITMDRVRIAFGRQQAVEIMLTADRTARNKRRAKKQAMG